jgi:hypothetical protein
MPIISRRGRKPVETPIDQDEIQITTDVFIYRSSSAPKPLTKEEREFLDEVFKDIRKQLDAICSSF